MFSENVKLHLSAEDKLVLEKAERDASFRTDFAQWATDLSQMLKLSKEKNDTSLEEMLTKSIENVTNKEVKQAFEECFKARIEESIPLPVALSKRSDIFDKWFLSIVTYGFFTCDMEEILRDFGLKNKKYCSDYFGLTAGKCGLLSKIRRIQTSIGEDYEQ